MTTPKRASHVTAELTAVVIAVRDGDPYVLTVESPAGGATALPSGPLQPSHRTLQSGLRNWVETQAKMTLGYVEQLYTFGDRPIPATDAGQRDNHRTISIAYLALVSMDEIEDPTHGRWRRWYEYFPWEDFRTGPPAPLAPMLKQLQGWAKQAGNAPKQEQLDRARLLFGTGDAPWDEERALERYELLYEAGLAPESVLDSGGEANSIPAKQFGAPMHADHRRMLATAMSRLRAKIKYRPVLFELMPQSFTFLQLQKTAEALSGVPLHKQNFRRLIMQQGLVEETGDVTADTGGRPAKLLRFRPEVTLERPAPGVRVRATRRGGYP